MSASSSVNASPAINFALALALLSILACASFSNRVFSASTLDQVIGFVSVSLPSVFKYVIAEIKPLFLVFEDRHIYRYARILPFSISILLNINIINI